MDDDMIDVPEIIEQTQDNIIYEMCEILNVSLQNPDDTYRDITDIFLELGEKIFGQKNADLKY